MPQVVFGKAVKRFLPSAIPTHLEKIDEYAVGKVLVYSKRPRRLIPMRKHELDFTGWSMQSLLAENEVLTITTAKSYLFDTGKDVDSKSFSVNVGGDLDIANALTKLASASAGFKFDAGEKATLKVTTDFGKITHISTDLVNSAISREIHVKPDHPIVKKAVENGGVMFIISNIYEGERCNVSATISKGEKESISGGAGVDGAKADVKESEGDKHSSTVVVSRDIPTPLAYMLIKVKVDSHGNVTTQLNKRFTETLHGGLKKAPKKPELKALSRQSTDPYDGWVMIELDTMRTPESDQPTKPVAEPVPKIEAVSKSEASPQEASEPRPVVEPVSVAEATPVLDAAPPESMGGQGATSKISHPFPTPSSEIPSAKVTEGTDKADGMPDDHYLYSLKDFQPFESNTYRGILDETNQWLVPFVSNGKLQTAFIEYTKLPGGYEKLNELSAYFLDLGNALRADQPQPPNKLPHVEPIMVALSEAKEKKLDEVSSVVIVAEAADEFPQHVIKKIFELAPDKRKILKELILQTPYGTSRHSYADNSPFKDPALKPIMSRMGFSLVGTSLTHIWKESDEEEDTLVSCLILLLASEK